MGMELRNSSYWVAIVVVVFFVGIFGFNWISLFLGLSIFADCFNAYCDLIEVISTLCARIKLLIKLFCLIFKVLG